MVGHTETHSSGFQANLSSELMKQQLKAKGFDLGPRRSRGGQSEGPENKPAAINTDAATGANFFPAIVQSGVRPVCICAGKWWCADCDRCCTYSLSPFAKPTHTREVTRQAPQMYLIVQAMKQSLPTVPLSRRMTWPPTSPQTASHVGRFSCQRKSLVHRCASIKASVNVPECILWRLSGVSLEWTRAS